jgi:histidinol-phosphate/aromatic aminotransferase/cobyric acid decarboxylase-like protein
MAKTPEDVIRDEIRALTAYHVPDSSGMVKLDAMENPYRLPPELRSQLARLLEEASSIAIPIRGLPRSKDGCARRWACRTGWICCWATGPTS